MSRARTRRARIEERTLRIGFGIKRASQREIGLPELLAFQPALHRRKPIPFGPFLSNQLFRLNHGLTIEPTRADGDIFLAETAMTGGKLMDPSAGLCRKRARAARCKA
jgi:hypothetical protein